MGSHKDQFRTNVFRFIGAHGRIDALLSCFIARGGDDASFGIMSDRHRFSFQAWIIEDLALAEEGIEINMADSLHFSWWNS